MRSPAGRFHSGSGCMLMRMRVPVRSLPGNKVSRLRIDSSCACPASARRHPSVSCGRRVRDNKQQPFPPGHVYCLGSLNISANPSRSTSLSIWPSFSPLPLPLLLSSFKHRLASKRGGFFFTFVFTRAGGFIPGKKEEKVCFRHAALALVSPPHCDRTSSRM